MNAKLGGCLIGYGLKKKNGEFKKVIFDKPIHNTITKHCLNNLLMFNGSNSLPSGNQGGNYLSLFVKSSSTSDRYGVFNSCCLGDGTGETSVNDTDLKHRVSAQTTTKKTGSGWCVSDVDYSNAVIKQRISHKHSIDTDFTIKEIGWYNAILQDGLLNYTLSARVQLEDFVDVESGDSFYSIYELSISFQDVEKFTDLSVLGDGYRVNGLCFYEYGGTPYYPFPLINENGFPMLSTGSEFAPINYVDRYIQFVPIWSQYFYQSKTIRVNWNKNKSITKPEHSLRDNMSVNYSVDNVYDYVLDSFRRDCKLLINPSALGSNIYGISICGTYFRFGSFDANDNFSPSPITLNGSMKIKYRQSWSTDLLTPAP